MVAADNWGLRALSIGAAVVTMAKFKRQLEEQIVPEWREAYVNYELLMKDIQRIRDQRAELIICKGAYHPAMMNDPHGMALRSLKGQNIDTAATALPWPSDGELMIIECKRPDYNGDHRLYETEVLGVIGMVNETFFSRLDSQLDKVNKFYLTKEREYVIQYMKLEEQMEILLCRRRELVEISSASSCIQAVAAEGADHNSTDQVTNDFGELQGDVENGCTMACCDSKGSSNDMKKRKLNHAENMLRTAFIEYYRGLTFLRDYSALNKVAFERILKKYDKITGQQALSAKVIDCSYFSNTEKVLNLIERVEDLFTENFTKRNRRQALDLLNPSPQRNSDDNSLWIGLYTGLWILIFAFIFILNHPRTLNSLTEAKFTRSILIPIFSTMVLFLFHVYMYGFNMYLWWRAGINYTFIFKFATASELRRNEVMLLSTSITGVLMGSMLTHLFLRPKFEANLNTTLDMIPFGVFVGALALVFLPWNICYRATRFIFIRCIWRVICSPFYKVEFSDFFLADQLTSQIIALRNLEIVSSYYLGRSYKNLNHTKWTENSKIRTLQLIVAVLPYWWRLMQCVRRWIDEKDRSQISNGGKYLSALTAVSIRLTYDTKKKGPWLALYIISYVIATVYQFYWDVVMDWGLLQPRSVNPWLRDQLMLKGKTFYFISMAVNGLLRLAWLCPTIFQLLPVTPIGKEYVDIILAMVEIGRRGLWNFYRLESEHVKNVDKLRAVQGVAEDG